MVPWLRILLIVVGSIIFAFSVGNAVKIEQTAGYYKCSACNHKYVPTYKSVFWAKHMGRTRKMKCPKCGEKSWQRKILK
jgi:DNA-directed RNA polymerase subunit RPC12/RpoP